MTQIDLLTLTDAIVWHIVLVSEPPAVTVGQCYFSAAAHKFYIADSTKKADGVTYN